MKRRTFTAAAATGTLAGLGGCLGQLAGSDEESTSTTAESTTQVDEDATTAGGDGDGSLAADEDGYPEEVDAKPEDREVDTSDLDTVEENGVEVPLLPVDDAYVWWAYRRARFADARGTGQYENSHVVGAVSSPADPNMRGDDDPVKQWGKDDRIVCYCGCPHHLSSIRASQLIDEGYENVYVIDEGFFEWKGRDYPVTSGDDGLNEFTVSGRVDARHAGENAWARHLESDQIESTNVADDGSFALHCKFVDVTATSRIRIDTPAWTTTGTVAELTAGVLDGD